jgi:hypothetical protein
MLYGCVVSKSWYGGPQFLIIPANIFSRLPAVDILRQTRSANLQAPRTHSYAGGILYLRHWGPHKRRIRVRHPSLRPWYIPLLSAIY